jgi:hypothetical protein
MKITIIEFERFNICGTFDLATMYFVNGKRISRNDYFQQYSLLDTNKWEYVNSKYFTKNSNNSTKQYTIIEYKERD